MDKGRHQLQRKEGTCTLCSMTRAALAGVLLTATLATVASGCGDSKTYSQGQVKNAFKSHGFRLTGTGGELVPATNSGVLFFTVEVPQEREGIAEILPACRKRRALPRDRARSDLCLRSPKEKRGRFVQGGTRS